METYHNSYNKNEDYMMWEIHEIRHKLHKERKNKSLDEINRESLNKFSQWQKETNAEAINMLTICSPPKSGKKDEFLPQIENNKYESNQHCPDRKLRAHATVGLYRCPLHRLDFQTGCVCSISRRVGNISMAVRFFEKNRA